MARPTIAFLCVRNAGRSQMAAALARRLGGDRVRVIGGGSDPADSVHPEVVEAMSELGIDLSEARPRRWDPEELRTADVIVTMGCGETCPVIPGVRYEDWAVPDPGDRPLAEVRRIRDDIAHRVTDLLERLGVENRT